MLQVARKTLDQLAETGYVDTEDSRQSVRAEKIVAETGLLVLAASGVPDEEAAAAAAELAKRLVPYARSDRMLMGVALEPAAAWDYSQAHVFLTRLGTPDADFDALLRESDAAQSASGRERVPHRVLERNWLRRGLAEEWATSQLDPLATDGVLESSIDLLTCTREDVYAFSHALMYIGDFGIRPLTWPRDPSDICAEAQGALGWCLDGQDYDLAAEVLLAWPQTDSDWSAPAVFALQVLASVEDRAGFLPSHTIQLERLRALAGTEHTNYLLASSYHTIYVMGLLCAATLRSEKFLPASVSPSGETSGAAEQIEPFLRFDRTLHWVDLYRRLTPSQRDALAPLTFGIAVRRCVEARQFGSIRELLEVAQRVGLSDSPLASQAAQLIRRLEIVTRLLQN